MGRKLRNKTLDNKEHETEEERQSDEENVSTDEDTSTQLDDIVGDIRNMILTYRDQQCLPICEYLTPKAMLDFIAFILENSY